MPGTGFGVRCRCDSRDWAGFAQDHRNTYLNIKGETHENRNWSFRRV